MFNPFSFIPQFAKKWTDGTRFDIIKTIGALIIWFPCILLLKAWNEVDSWNDVITVNAYRTHIPDSTEILKGNIISIKHPYMSFSKMYKQKFHLDYFFYAHTSSKKGIFQSKDSTLLSDYIDIYGIKNIETDSIIGFFEINYSLYVSEGQKANYHLNLNDSLRSEKYISNIECDDNKLYLNKRHIAKITKSQNGYNMPAFLKNESNVDISIPQPYKLVFKLKDVSQCYYNLQFKGNTDFKLDTLRINFGGAARFSGIDPSPDIYSYNGFEYTNKEKIDKIKRNGLTVFCQFLEATGLQNVRIYLLSTIATLFFGIFIKLCLELLWRRFKIIIHKSNK